MRRVIVFLPFFRTAKFSVATRISPKLVLELGVLDRLLQVRPHLVLVPRIGVNRVPLLGHERLVSAPA